jgi:hypothetical protein
MLATLPTAEVVPDVLSSEIPEPGSPWEGTPTQLVRCGLSICEDSRNCSSFD